MAICHFKLDPPKLLEGIKYFEVALKNKEKLHVPDSAIVSAFKDFASACIKQNKEQTLVDFINANRAVITLDPYKMYRFTPFFMKYGAQAFNKHMVKGAFALYALMPGTLETKDDLTVRLNSLSGFKGDVVRDYFLNKNDSVSIPLLKADLAHVKAEIRSGDPHELVALKQLAYLHEDEGYVRGAFGVYEMLEFYYPKSKKREDNLYNLVRTSSLIGEVLKTEKYGHLFLKDFPKSEYRESVKQMMLISLFYSGEYETALKVAEKFLPTLSENTKQHDLCLHVYGGSLYYLGRYFDAYKPLIKHVKMYPKSDYKMAARYFEASNYSRMQDWPKAAEKLDKFLADFPDPSTNIYTPFALYDRAQTHFSEQEYKEAVEKLDRIEKEFSGSAVEDMAYNLRGDVLRASHDLEGSEKYYRKALALAKRRENRIVAAEALYKLVALLGVEKIDKKPNPHITKAVEPYDEFWKDYQDSAYKVQVAAAGTPALMAAKRGDEALANLASVIAELAKKEQAPGMGAAINTYGKYYLQAGHTAEELKNHFENFKGIDAGDVRAQALLRIAIIGVYEDLLKKAKKEKNQDLVDKYSTKIKVMFQHMDRKFKPSDLSDFILIKLANFISTKLENPRQALKYYDEILKRGKKQFRTRAQFGRAGILAKSDKKSDQDSALKTLLAVRDNKDSSRKVRDSATSQLVDLYYKQQNWDKVIEEARRYSRDRYKQKKAEVALKLAQAYDQKGSKLEALSAFGLLADRYKSRWAVSLPALYRYCELSAEVGKSVKGKSGKQIGYEKAAKFLRGTRKAYKDNKLTMPEETRAAYEKLQKLVKKWEASGSVRTLEQIEKDRQNQ